MSETCVRRQGLHTTWRGSYLTPPWSTEANSEHGQQPGVRLAQGGEDIEHERPNTDEK
jgi:hypothetical protein